MTMRWRDLSRAQRGVLVAVGVAEGALKVAMLVDLRRRRPEEVRGPRWAWAASAAINSAGLIPASYFLLGRVR